MATLDRDRPAAADRIDLAVARELARRKRLLRFYLLLLLVPIGVAAWAVWSGFRAESHFATSSNGPDLPPGPHPEVQIMAVHRGLDERLARLEEKLDAIEKNQTLLQQEIENLRPEAQPQPIRDLDKLKLQPLNPDLQKPPG
jgi:hypothetical protein